MRARKVLAVPLAAVLVLAMGAAPATAGPPETPPAIKVEGNATQPVFSRADAIKQTVFVEVAGTDSDSDGSPDRVAVDILRPKETDQGLKVPVIMEASPYYAGGNDVPNHVVDVDDDGNPLPSLWARANKLAAEPFDGYYDNYFLPRGYAIALVENLGSGRATGCPTTGDRNETAGPKAAIDWLNGRARAFTAGEPVSASWSTGKVGMIGVSYNGTLPNAVASTGVKGLETIVPIAAISSWYDYYRANGGVVAPGGFQGEDTDVLAKYVLTRADGQRVCGPVMEHLTAAQDRITGDYSRFWDVRNYLNDVGKVRASVFLVHGLNDWNVKTKQFAQWWEALAKRHIPRKIWLHQGTHMSPFNLRTVEWLRQLHGWFDYWLYGIDSGIMREPQADVEIGPGDWGRYASWPLPGATPVRLRLGQNSELGPLTRPWPGRESFVDQKDRTAEQLVESAPAPDPNRLAYLTSELPADVRISGTPEVSVRASFSGGSSPYLTALLVDYGEDVRPDGSLVPTGETLCYGQGVPGDTGCTALRRLGTATTPYKIVSRGWLDVRNRAGMDRTQPLRPGKEYTFTWDFQPKDYLFKQGHRIGLVIISTDRDYTLRYPPGTRVELSPGRSSLTLPVVAGRVT
ncbi:Xaa-Pro dipeptidyl-peptidase [Nonomuraea sp. NPDC000554]|uniref:Xaa-Pro dipeptidyl-peptidase n=1 Tax=Nonomuraea sp. NPDC000554 TaxID=3154259 RepID=UPI00332EFA04